MFYIFILAYLDNCFTAVVAGPPYFKLAILSHLQWLLKSFLLLRLYHVRDTA